jgi:hypothetical protein
MQKGLLSALEQRLWRFVSGAGEQACKNYKNGEDGYGL